MLDFIFDAVDGFFELVGDAIEIIVVGIFSFFNDVVTWFKNKYLNPQVDVPVVMDMNKVPELKAKIKNAPNKHCGIFEGVYNQNTDSLEGRYVGADSLDEKTKEVLDGEAIVTLS